MENKFVQRYYSLINPATPNETKEDYDLLVSCKQGSGAGVTFFKDKEYKDYHSAIYSDGKTDYLLREYLESFGTGKTDISFVDENGNFNNFTAKFWETKLDKSVVNTGYTIDAEGQVILTPIEEIKESFETAFNAILKIEEKYMQPTVGVPTEMPAEQ